MHYPTDPDQPGPIYFKTATTSSMKRPQCLKGPMQWCPTFITFWRTLSIEKKKFVLYADNGWLVLSCTWWLTYSSVMTWYSFLPHIEINLVNNFSMLFSDSLFQSSEFVFGYHFFFCLFIIRFECENTQHQCMFAAVRRKQCHAV